MTTSAQVHGTVPTDTPTELEEVMLNISGIIIHELKLNDVTRETFDPDLDLIDELGIDSMDLATIALIIQDEYAIVIDEEDYPKLKSVRIISEYIQKELASI